MILYTLSPTNKVLRYGENNQVDFLEHPVVIQQSEEQPEKMCKSGEIKSFADVHCFTFGSIIRCR